jgi:hypothetical protein
VHLFRTFRGHRLSKASVNATSLGLSDKQTGDNHDPHRVGKRTAHFCWPHSRCLWRCLFRSCIVPRRRCRYFSVPRRQFGPVKPHPNARLSRHRFVCAVMGRCRANTRQGLAMPFACSPGCMSSRLSFSTRHVAIATVLAVRQPPRPSPSSALSILRRHSSRR